MMKAETQSLLDPNDYKVFKSRKWISVGALLVVGVCMLLGLSWNGLDSERMSLLSLRKHEQVCNDGVQQESGYIELPHRKDDHYFYWFYESRNSPKTDPLVLWLTGGPGCSSMMALLTENGPCMIEKDVNLKRNPYSWNSKANVIWLDQPSGVGYSYGPLREFEHTETEVGENVFGFLKVWLRKHPEFYDREFYIFAESYGGHYAPAAAYYMYKRQASKDTAEDKFVKLTGMGIGNGLTDPMIQYQYAKDLAVNNNYGKTLVSSVTYADMERAQPTCLQLIAACQADKSVCPCAIDFCEGQLVNPILEEGQVNPYDLRKSCIGAGGIECYNQLPVRTFLNDKRVMQNLNVNRKHVHSWQECNNIVYNDFSLDWMQSYEQLIPPMLKDGIRVVIYAGDADLMCNWLGNKMWTLALNWPGKDGFNQAKDEPYIVDDKTVGTVRQYGGFSFMRVSNSGHMVPMDQPSVSLKMFNTFIANEEF